MLYIKSNQHQRSLFTISTIYQGVYGSKIGNTSRDYSGSVEQKSKDTDHFDRTLDILGDLASKSLRMLVVKEVYQRRCCPKPNIGD